MMMKTFITIILSLMLVANVSLAAEEVVVITNSANTQTLGKSNIKNIYSDIVTTWENGKRIKVYNLPLGASERELFSQHVLGMSATSAEKELNNKKITNTLKNPPKTKRAKLVVSIVSRNPNAIAYVPADAVQGKTGVRVVLELK
jgi:ABC-type phosphate transport system substrate-binding protein